MLLFFIGFVVTLIALFPERVKNFFIQVLNWIQMNKIIGSGVFIGLYIVATVLCLPASILTLGSGFIFKLLWGFCVVWVGATIGLTAAFFLGRTVLRGWIEKQVQMSPKFQAVDSAIEHKGWIIVLLVRLTPILPFNLLNYALALTKIKWWQYIVVSAVGIVPGSLLYTYLGSVAGDLSDIIRGQSTTLSLTTQIIIWTVSGGLILTTVIFVTVMAKRAINRVMNEQRAPLERHNETTTLISNEPASDDRQSLLGPT
jgi:uncharacterized membrane protein YdjX (TVP38/TMEM64 family)